MKRSWVSLYWLYQAMWSEPQSLEKAVMNFIRWKNYFKEEQEETKKKFLVFRSDEQETPFWYKDISLVQSVKTMKDI